MWKEETLIYVVYHRAQISHHSRNLTFEQAGYVNFRSVKKRARFNVAARFWRFNASFCVPFSEKHSQTLDTKWYTSNIWNSSICNSFWQNLLNRIEIINILIVLLLIREFRLQTPVWPWRILGECLQKLPLQVLWKKQNNYFSLKIYFENLKTHEIIKISSPLN